jgi:hypothetical protein
LIKDSIFHIDLNPRVKGKYKCVKVAPDLLGQIEFWGIILSIFLVPLLWILIRKEKSTDHEGHGKLPLELTEGAKKAGLPGIDYKLWSPLRYEHPDLKWYEEKVRKEAEEQVKKKSAEPA